MDFPVSSSWKMLNPAVGTQISPRLGTWQYLLELDVLHLSRSAKLSLYISSARNRPRNERMNHRQLPRSGITMGPCRRDATSGPRLFPGFFLRARLSLLNHSQASKQQARENYALPTRGPGRAYVDIRLARPRLHTLLSRPQTREPNAGEAKLMGVQYHSVWPFMPRCGVHLPACFYSKPWNT